MFRKLSLSILSCCIISAAAFADDAKKNEIASPARTADKAPAVNQNLPDGKAPSAPVPASIPALVSEKTLPPDPLDPPQPGFWERFEYAFDYYMPNRMLDFGDIVTFDVGAGSESAVFCKASEYIQCGASYGARYFVSEIYARKYSPNFRPDPEVFYEYLNANMPYGAGYYSGWNYGLLCFSQQRNMVSGALGKQADFEHFTSFGIPSFNEEVYKKKVKDFWGIEARVSLGWSFGVSVHPLEIIDFAAGFLLIDISDDDLPGSSIF